MVHRLVVGGLLFVLGGCAPTAPTDHARALEGRLMAPCCWVQTLDVHESELASALREEIDERLAAGEASTSIEASLVERFGERIHAVPATRDPRQALAAGSTLAALAGLAGLAWAMRRWRRRAVDFPVPRSSARDGYDERLDEELAQDEPSSF